MNKPRVVITGMGVVTPLGIGVASYWDSCVRGRSGVRRISAFDPTGLTSQIAGEVRDFDPLDHMSEKLTRRTERFTHFAIAAVQQAADQAGGLVGVAPERLGITLGNGGGGLGVLDKFPLISAVTGWERTDRFALLKALPDMATANLAMRFGAKGPALTLVASCVSSTQAIGEGLRLIRDGSADAVIACGTEAGVTRIGMTGFCLLHALSTRNDAPERASRPFDAGRDGFVLSEGAGAIIMERLDHAQGRGVEPIADVLGYGRTSDAYHLVSPSPEGEGAARCVRAALADAEIEPADIDYVNAHGTSTKLNDVAETKAMKAVFGARASDVPMSSIKSMMGHSLGAAGAIETIAAVMTLRTGTLPPTINLENPAPGCDLDYVADGPRSKPVEIVLKNSFGFGGQNASLVLGKPARA